MSVQCGPEYAPSNTDPEDLTNTWYDLIKKASEGKELCVLPGVEISTDDLHILIILAPNEEEPAAYTTHRISFLLRDCKFTLKEYGDYKATGMSSLFDVLEYIENLGTSCIAIPAHIDGGNKAVLSVYKSPSNVFRKILNHPNLNVVEVTKDTTPEKKKIGKEKVKDYFEKIRDKDRSPIAYIQNSDGHATKEIGKRFSYVRMGKPGFWSLKNSLEDPDTRVRMEKNYKPDAGKTRILGISFSKKGKAKHIAFNENLNCIIGKKQTNKSKIIDLILYGLGKLEEKEKYSVDVFIKKNSEVICFHRESKDDNPILFKLKNNSFVPFSEAVDFELPKKYNHQGVENAFSQRTSLMNFLDKYIFTDKKLHTLIENRNSYLKTIKQQGIENSSQEIKKLVKICENLFEKRTSQKNIRVKQKKGYSEVYLNEYGGKSGKSIFKVKLRKGKWSNGSKIKSLDDFTDKAELHVLVKSKYKPINRLKTGEKNASIMVLLMNQGAFGPLIIDEPEQHLDVSSITGILIPRMRKLKTKQQIICVTKDEHILLSGDAENVIVTQSEDKIETISGDINSKEIQHQILEIFEGDRLALMNKNRKLGRILEENQ